MQKIMAVIGAQWGDEGKGKFVDYLYPGCSMAARFNGGNNAGHSVETIENGRQRVHLLPANAYRDGAVCILGNGMVIDLDVLKEEIQRVMEVNRSVEVIVDRRAHIITNEHKAKDQEDEEKRSIKIGTTSRGIGPAYADKMYRKGMRVCDIDPQFFWSIRCAVADTTMILNNAISGGDSVLFAGAHGTMLDIDHGAYPYVTSSNCIAAAVGTGAGVDPRRITDAIGVMKAYSTRVGGGPFPSEMDEEAASAIRKKGKEYGTTTGRPRRIGWLDIPALRRSALINQFDYFAISMLDVLSVVREVRICISYKYSSQSGIGEDFPMNDSEYSSLTGEYITMKGWSEESVLGKTNFCELPEEAKLYIRTIEFMTKVPVKIISTGPRRDQTIDRR